MISYIFSMPIKIKHRNLKTAFSIYSRNNGMRARAARNDIRAIGLCGLSAFGKAKDAVRQLAVTAAECGALSGNGCLGSAVNRAVMSGWLSRSTAEKWMTLFSAQSCYPPMYAVLHAFRMLSIKNCPPDPVLLAYDIAEWVDGGGDSVAKRWVLAFYTSKGQSSDVFDDDNA